MRFRITGAVAVFVLAAIAFLPGISTAEDEQPAAQPVPQQAQPQTLRNGCSKLYTQKSFKKYVRKVYRRDSISKKAKRHTLKMMRCQHSPKAERNMRAFRHKQIDNRVLRARMYCGTPSCNRYLLVYMASHRFGQSGANCLIPIISQESGFDHTVHNGGGHGYVPGKAYGLPQALPGSKMASAGRDWMTNPATQIRWLLGYVSRYGGPCGALSVKRSTGVY